MNSQKNRLYLVAGIWFLVTAFARYQIPVASYQVKPLTLQDAIAMAQARSPLAQVARSSRDAARLLG